MEADEVIHQKHVKLGVIGNVDSGKSTLVGVLTKGLMDDGNGAARLRVMNYRHEQDTGRTSSIGQEIMGFDKKGKQIIPERFNQNKNKYWKEIVENSEKIISLVDLCGHEKYLKTTYVDLSSLDLFSCLDHGSPASLLLRQNTRCLFWLCRLRPHPCQQQAPSHSHDTASFESLL